MGKEERTTEIILEEKDSAFIFREKSLETVLSPIGKGSYVILMMAWLLSEEKELEILSKKFDKFIKSDKSKGVS